MEPTFETLHQLHECHKLLMRFFEGDANKSKLWMETKNPLLGDVSPSYLLEIGRAHKVIEFIKGRLEENGAPDEG